jgi:hypothetical protein
VPLHARDVGISVGWATCTLTLPQHFPQALHDIVVGFVQGVAFMRQQLYRLADTTRLVNAALLANA